MTRHRKLLICPHFGRLPGWHAHWERDMTRLADHGYDLLLDTDLNAFRRRAHETLQVAYPSDPDLRKPCAYRPAFAAMYADEIEGYDWWGHTDLDCVYGRINEFVTDAFLHELDFHTDHHYLCGPWTLYRNRPEINELFRTVDGWADLLQDPDEVGWGETSFTWALNAAEASGLIRCAYTAWHAYTAQDLVRARRDGDRLVVDDREVPMIHFRRSKVYPPQLVRP